ncbi:MAG: hypothetical protein R2697_00790 [Ilumatobacteraceae bacterium]
MAIVSETKLPGVGVRQEFSTAQGNIIGVLNHHDGRRDIMVYDSVDPDKCTSILHLDRRHPHPGVAPGCEPDHREHGRRSAGGRGHSRSSG